ncbi:MAG: bifunctional UDP-N-acetylglucosamine diphosphorylase/glucosamine-1-phosphate N-acetyltransferase GlmU [Thermosulfidibacteraceae bacterium]|jgi:bifunctional UDP-N-acetylglucosamine pyrophosphorylase/glucosamine-1-phosphate N-acetyltransferase
MKVDTIILAAGKGTRMKSEIPKVLHKIGTKSMLEIIIEKLKNISDKIIIVIGFKGNMVKEKFEKIYSDIHFVEQREQLGTAHAVRVALNSIEGDVSLIIPGDAPFVKRETLSKMVEMLKEADMIALLMEVRNPKGYGRAILERDRLVRIVEESDLNNEEKNINIVNTGIYAIKTALLREFIESVKLNPKKSEFYFTDIVEILDRNGKIVKYIIVEEEEGMGINDRKQLIKAYKERNLKKVEELLERGVTILSPENTYIDEEVEIGIDTVIWPYVFITGNTRIGKNCEIKPFTVIINSTIQDGCNIREYSHIEGAVVEEEVIIGPFARIRPNTLIKKGARIGNFVELKNTIMGEKSQANHLAYLGDATIGNGVNIGAGVITCNYDGVRKNPTFIDDGAFIGSDCQLVAPVRIGKNVLVGAGTTVTKDVPDESLAVSRAPLKIIEGKGMTYYRNKRSR